MDLYFLRHGLAGQHGDPKYKDDSLRPLTEEGREKMGLTSLGMLAMGLTFDVILSSPYLRAKQTAEAVCRSYDLKDKDLHITTNLLAPASIGSLLKEVRSLFPKSKSFLFVGHEPHLTHMISSLLNCDEPLAIDLKKGGLCHLSIPDLNKDRSAQLQWILTPAQLASLAVKRRIKEKR